MGLDPVIRQRRVRGAAEVSETLMTSTRGAGGVRRTICAVITTSEPTGEISIDGMRVERDRG